MCLFQIEFMGVLTQPRPTADIHIVDLAEPSFETDLEKESRDFFLKTQ